MIYEIEILVDLNLLIYGPLFLACFFLHVIFEFFALSKELTKNSLITLVYLRLCISSASPHLTTLAFCSYGGRRDLLDWLELHWLDTDTGSLK